MWTWGTRTHTHSIITVEMSANILNWFAGICVFVLCLRCVCGADLQFVAMQNKLDMNTNTHTRPSKHTPSSWDILFFTFTMPNETKGAPMEIRPWKKSCCSFKYAKRNEYLQMAWKKGDVIKQQQQRQQQQCNRSTNPMGPHRATPLITNSKWMNERFYFLSYWNVSASAETEICRSQ